MLPILRTLRLAAEDADSRRIRAEARLPAAASAAEDRTGDSPLARTPAVLTEARLSRLQRLAPEELVRRIRTTA